MPLRTLRYDFIVDYETFLHTEFGNKLNTIDTKARKFKAVISYALKEKYISTNPFADHVGKTELTSRKYLTERELKEIENLQLTGTRSVIKDLFLFTCYTGLSYQDLFSLKKSEFVNGENDKEFIVKQRGKTTVQAIIPVYKKAKQIVQKFENQRSLNNDQIIFPYFSNKTMNDNIRGIGELLNFEKKLSCHVGRHTLATLALENKAPLETVSKVLGHGSIKTTQLYGRITQSKIDTDFTAAQKFLG